MHLSIGRHFVGLWLCQVYVCDAGTSQMDCIIDLELLDRGDSGHRALQSAKLGPLGSYCCWRLLAALPSTGSA